jgi:hypothetical protein
MILLNYSSKYIEFLLFSVKFCGTLPSKPLFLKHYYSKTPTIGIWIPNYPDRFFGEIRFRRRVRVWSLTLVVSDTYPLEFLGRQKPTAHLSPLPASHFPVICNDLFPSISRTQLLFASLPSPPLLILSLNIITSIFCHSLTACVLD